VDSGRRKQIKNAFVRDDRGLANTSTLPLTLWWSIPQAATGGGDGRGAGGAVGSGAGGGARRRGPRRGGAAAAGVPRGGRPPPVALRGPAARPGHTQVRMMREISFLFYYFSFRLAFGCWRRQGTDGSCFSVVGRRLFIFVGPGSWSIDESLGDS
jgi:hypothetical protein